jgi:L-aminopeptidase/D-esterase-like protein
MRCYGYKGGSGTSSRVEPATGYTIGAFVQANFGRREDLMMRGVHVGREPGPVETPASGFGSIIVVLATDAPLSAAQLAGIARRATMGVGRTGTAGQHESGDLFVAFTTAPFDEPGHVQDTSLSPLFSATADAVEEAILNALVAAASMTGFKGRSVPALDHDLVRRLASDAPPVSRP